MGMIFRIAASAAACLLMVGLGAQAQSLSKLRIATEGANPPFNEVNARGEVQGFDVDLARAICDRLKRDCEIVTQDWDGMIPALLSRKFDAIVASMSITPERLNVVAFSEAYYRSPSVFIVRKSAKSDSITPDAMKGRAIGAQSGTNQAGYLQDKYKDSEVRLYTAIADAYRDLDAGRVDAVMYDKLPAYDWLSKPDGACCRVIGGDIHDLQYLPEDIGIAFRKDDTDLRTKVNVALRGLVLDGTYKAINAKYFPFDIH